MSRTRKVVLLVVVAVLAVAAWFAYNFLYALRHLPEAYAAWDTGTLLVEYLETHDNRWPKSWDDLLSVLETERGRDLPLRGSTAGDLNYARSLREKVAVDWNFDLARIEHASPVTRPDGSDFPIVWEGAEPNDMIREHLKASADTPQRP